MFTPEWLIHWLAVILQKHAGYLSLCVVPVSKVSVMLGVVISWKHVSLPLALLWVKIWRQTMCCLHSPVAKLRLLGHGSPWACEVAGSSHWSDSPTCDGDALQKALLEPPDFSIDVLEISFCFVVFFLLLLLACTRLGGFVRGREKTVLFAWLCLLSVLKSRSSQQWKPVLGELPVTSRLSPLSSLPVLDDKCQRPCYGVGWANHSLFKQSPSWSSPCVAITWALCSPRG